jgi:hypothetical protein
MRWKGFSTFMFWACFSYDRKGPCHIWKKQTAAENPEYDEEIAEWNVIAESLYKAAWETKYLGERWVWTAETGKRERRAKKGGIDWVRYGKLILEPKLLPFAFDCKKQRPYTVVQEDGTLISIRLRMSASTSGAFANFFGLETVLILTLLSLVGLISSGERRSEALRVEGLSYAKDGRKNGRNYLRNAFRSGSSESIDM